MKRSIVTALAGLVVAGSATLATTVALAQTSVEVQAQSRTFDREQPSFGVRWTYAYPQPRHMNRVQALAHRVEDSARRIAQQAEAQRRRFTWREERALRQLRVLDEAARRFHAQVERSLQYPSRTDADFRNLVGAYYRSAFGFRNFHSFDFIQRDFRSLGTMVDQLMFYYDGYDYLGGRADDRYGRQEQRNDDGFDHDYGYDMNDEERP